MPIDIQALPLDSINTKWKEPYASASLNRRFVGITPQGIYRGLTLTEDSLAGDRTVIISQDVENSDHVAVYQNEDEYQIGYRDTTSGDITLTLTAYSSVDVLVTLFIDYQLGLATSGTYRIYTQAEFDGLGASFRNTLIVLGTVTVPASGAIGASSISANSRTLASANIQPGTIPSTLISRNPNFDVGEVNQSYELSSQFWEKSVSAGTGAWKTSSDRASSGVKSIELTVSVAPFTGSIRQWAGIEVTAGQLITVNMDVWQDATISSGTFVFFMEFSDSTGALLSTSSSTLDGGAADGGWREVAVSLNPPVGATTIRSFGVQCIALDPDVLGVFAYVDSLRVLVEPRVATEAHVFDQRFRQRESVSSIRLMDKDGNFADPSADIAYDKASNKLSLSPSNPADPDPDFEVAGDIIATTVEATTVKHGTRILMCPAAGFVREAVADWQYSNVTGAIFFNNGEERAVYGLPLHVGDTIESVKFFATGGGTTLDMKFEILYGFPTSGSGATIGSELDNTTGSFSVVVTPTFAEDVIEGRPYMLRVTSSVGATSDRFSHAEVSYKSTP